MIAFEHVIKGIEGLHARPVALIASEALKWGSAVRVAFGEKSADARDLMGLMMLDARRGDVLRVSIEGEDEAACAEAMRAVFVF